MQNIAINRHEKIMQKHDLALNHQNSFINYLY
jgi:hypothetical protein